MSWSDYKKDVCARAAGADRVDIRQVEPIDDWEPVAADCHNNVNRWVKYHPEDTAVRGWVAYAPYGDGSLGFTAHSVIRGTDGVLFDITPTIDPDAYRGPFVEHLGDDWSFFEQEKLKKEIRCQNGDCAPELTPDMLAAMPAILDEGAL